MENCNYQEDLYRERKLVVNLAKEIDYKNQKLQQMEHNMEVISADNQKLVMALEEQIQSREECYLELTSKYHEKCSLTIRLTNERDVLCHLMEEKDMLQGRYIEEIERLRSMCTELMQDNTHLKKELEKRAKESEQYKALIGKDQNALMVKTEKSEVKDSSLQLATSKELMQADEDELSLAEDPKLKGNLHGQNPTESGHDVEAQICNLKAKLEEKTYRLDDLEDINNALIIKESISNQELQAARKESIRGLRDMLNKRSPLQIKQMGAIDPKPFQDTCSKKFPDKDWKEISAKLCSEWEQYVGDPHWHPFKRDGIEGKAREMIDEGDEKLKGLRNEQGEAAYKAVADALLEMNEYNPSGGYVVSEIWKVKEGRKATLKEIIEYLMNQLKTHKRKRKRT